MKSKACCILLVYLLGASAHGQTPQPMDCESNEACVALVDQAQKQSKAGHLVDAEKSYRLAYEVSHDARLLFNIARVLEKQGNSPEATKFYRLFIEAPIEAPEQKAKARASVAQLEEKNDSLQEKLHPGPSAQPTPSGTNTDIPTTERKTPPLYRKGWFWGVLVGSVAAIGLGIGLGVGLSNRTMRVPSGTNTIAPTF